MKRLMRSAAVLLAVTAAACAPETTAPGPERDPTLPQGRPIPTTHEVEAITAALNALSGFVPNTQSLVSHFDALVSAVNAYPPPSPEVDAALAALIAKIELEYNKYVTPPQNGNPNALITCTPGLDGCDGEVTITEFVDLIYQAIYVYAGLLDGEGTICKIGPTDTDETVCEVPEEEGKTGFVWLPPGLADKLTFISVKTAGPGFLETFLDEHETSIEVKSAPITTFPDESNRPLVVVCYPDDTDYDVAVRIRLGQRHGIPGEEGSYFKILPTPVLTEDQQGYAEEFCGPAPTETAFFGKSGSGFLARFVDRALNTLMPKPLQASAFQPFMLGFGGAGGTPGEWSWFGAVDIGMSFGGAGGTPGEWAPPVQAAPAATTGASTGPITGVVGTQTSGVPTITVTTPGGTPVAGVTVTFALSGTSAAYQPGSEASFCGATTVVTNSDGEAALPCLAFGSEPGYKNLKATVNPSTIPDVIDEAGALCMIIPGGECEPTGELNFLVQTVAPTVYSSCTLGGSKDNILQYGFRVGANNPKDIIWVGVNLSSTGAPGPAQSSTVTLTATWSGGSATATATLAYGPNQTKTVEQATIFKLSQPIPAGTPANFSMAATDENGVPLTPSSQRKLNMNAGGCGTGNRFNACVLPPAPSCIVTETSATGDYRKGLPVQLFGTP